jgi:hypothetical protein
MVVRAYLEEGEVERVAVSPLRNGDLQRYLRLLLVFLILSALLRFHFGPDFIGQLLSLGRLLLTQACILIKLWRE